MSQITQRTPWSTILKQSPSMPSGMKSKKRGIFLGWTKDDKFIRVIKEGTATHSTYAPEFWEVDTSYMTDREEIAELMGRIHESNEPTDIEDYRSEIETIQRRMRS
jgi:hypothetical protein